MFFKKEMFYVFLLTQYLIYVTKRNNSFSKSGQLVCDLHICILTGLTCYRVNEICSLVSRETQTDYFVDKHNNQEQQLCFQNTNQ